MGKSYEDAWRVLRVRKRRFYLWWLLFIPVSVVLLMLLGLLLPERVLERWERLDDALFCALALVWLTGCCVTAWLAFGEFRCPRCGKLFHVGDFRGNVFATRCVHCGLERGTP